MDRMLIAKSEHNVTLRQKVGTAQNLYLSDAQQRGLAAGADWSITSTIQRPALLQSLQVNVTDDQADLTDVTVSGLSLFVSDQTCAAACFNSKSFGARKRSIGISINNNQTVVVQGKNVVAASTAGVAVAIDPLDSSAVKSPSEQAERFNFVFGLGSVSVPAGAAATASLIATATRPCTLGEIILANHSTGATAVKSEDIVIEDIIVAGLSMLAGATATQQIPLTVFENSASDIAGLSLNYPIEANARVEVKLRNYDGANACDIAGGILVEPWK